MKIKDFVTIFESQKMTFGLRQSTTYEHNHKMTASEVMLWCEPNYTLVKIIDFVEILKCEKIILP